MAVQPQRALPVALVLALAACAAPTEHVLTWEDRGVAVRLEVGMGPPGAVDRVESEARDAVRRTRLALSADVEDGELARLNGAAGDDYVEVRDRDLYRALLLALDWARASRGAYDPTIGPVTRLWRRHEGPPPGRELTAALDAVDWSRVVVAEEARSVLFRDPGMSLDLGPLVDGFAADAAARVFSLPGARRGSVVVGSAGYVWSGARDAVPAAVAIPDAGRPGETLLTLRLTNRAFAVSMPCGAACAGPPPLDPTTGLPPERGVRAAVAVADSAADAAAVARALHASSPQRAGDLLTRSRRVEAIVLVDDRDEGPVALVSASLDGRVELGPSLLDEVEGRVRFVLPPTRFPPP